MGRTSLIRFTFRLSSFCLLARIAPITNVLSEFPISMTVGILTCTSSFADHSIYVTKFQEEELFAGGQYTNQNKQTTGVRKWAERDDDITDEDIVVWVQFGLQHVPRTEDFPVMYDLHRICLDHAGLTCFLGLSRSSR